MFSLTAIFSCFLRGRDQLGSVQALEKGAAGLQGNTHRTRGKSDGSRGLPASRTESPDPWPPRGICFFPQQANQQSTDSGTEKEASVNPSCLLVCEPVVQVCGKWL